MKTLFNLFIIFALMAVIVAGFFYGILDEVDQRELRADKKVYNQILADRASYERQAAREWTR